MVCSNARLKPCIVSIDPTLARLVLLSERLWAGGGDKSTQDILAQQGTVREEKSGGCDGGGDGGRWWRKRADINIV